MRRDAKRPALILAVAFAALAFLAACAVPPPQPDDRFYRLEPKAGAVMAKPLNGVVEVERFAASGALANRALLYAEPGSNAVSEYHYHYWIESPPVLLQGALVSYLRSAHAAARVVTPDMRIEPDYTVMGRVLRLETMRGEHPAGVVSVELALRRESDNTMMVLGEYRAEVPSGMDGLATDVAAIEQAVRDVFRRFLADIEKAAK